MKLKPQPIFYILLIYILLQFSWWAFMLIDLNGQIIEINQSGPKALNKKILMIAGEGLIFLVILIIGALLLHRSFKREVELGNQQKNFLLSTTHELKTPIASIKLMLETFKKRNLTPEQKTPLVDNALNETERLNTLIENLMLAAQFDNKKLDFKFKKLDLSELTRSIAERFTMNHSNIVVSIKPNLFLTSNEHMYSSILYNLIDNALKYSKEEVTLVLSEHNDSIELTVKDLGIGIPKEERSNIFKRFYRVGNEMTRNTKGTGLGLYIVQQIVKLHEATIRIEQNKPTGTIFTIQFNNANE